MLQLHALHRRLYPPFPPAPAPRSGGRAFAAVQCANFRPVYASIRAGGSRRGRRCPAGGEASMSKGPERWEAGEGEFLQASLLVPETIRHYNLLRQGFSEETKWRSPRKMDHALSLLQKGPVASINSVGHSFLHRFHNPTIFLKVVCDCDLLLLPIVVGDLAIESFLESLADSGKEGCASQFQFMSNLVGALRHEVEMVQITKRVINTYYANIVLSKPGGRTYLSVDSRPSDALSIANLLKVPIFVRKDIVFRDAIKVVYGTWRKNGAKTVYDVLLDSAIEGHDYLSEELDCLKKMNIAVNEERYSDAAIWRDKLEEVRRRSTIFSHITNMSSNAVNNMQDIL